ATGTAGAADFDAEFIRSDLDIDFLGLRKHGDGDCGGVNAALGFCGRDALYAVDAGFVFEETEDLFAADAEGDFLETADLRGRGAEVFGFPATEFGVAGVHPEQLRGEERCFIATGAGADFDDGIAVLIRVRGEEGVLEFFLKAGQRGAEGGEFLGGEFGEFGIGGCSDFLVFGDPGAGVEAGFPEIQGFLEAAVFAHEISGAAGIGKQGGVAKLFGQFAEAAMALIDEALVVHPGGLGDVRRGGRISGNETTAGREGARL
ncbi:MAG: hypothetical protein RLZ97_346, partial [Verrucomicrobiota bacterium]